MSSIASRADAWLLAALLVLTTLIATAIGGWAGRRAPSVTEYDATMEAAVFALLGLLLAFTFSLAGERYDFQRKLIVEEANAISTAAHRSDLYREPERAIFRAEFRDYLEARIADQRSRAAEERRRLWEHASRLGRDPANKLATFEMVTALNQMFEVASSRLGAERARVPNGVVTLLFTLFFAAAFLAAYLGARSRRYERSASIAFVTLAACAAFGTLELDRTRRGMIDLRASEQSLVDVRAVL